MQQTRVKRGLVDLNARFGSCLKVRVSLDHYTPALHEAEQGQRTWARTIAGIDRLAASGPTLALAGRRCWEESAPAMRQGYGRPTAERGWRLDPDNPAELVFLPEMDGRHDVAEITTRCWAILNRNPGDIRRYGDMMCASSRMLVKRRSDDRPTVVPCTLIPYDTNFDMGAALGQAARAEGAMFAAGAVKLCHPHCSKFCVLGGVAARAEPPFARLRSNPVRRRRRGLMPATLRYWTGRGNSRTMH